MLRIGLFYIFTKDLMSVCVSSIIHNLADRFPSMAEIFQVDLSEKKWYMNVIVDKYKLILWKQAICVSPEDYCLAACIRGNCKYILGPMTKSKTKTEIQVMGRVAYIRHCLSCWGSRVLGKVSKLSIKWLE